MYNPTHEKTKRKSTYGFLELKKLGMFERNTQFTTANVKLTILSAEIV